MSILSFFKRNRFSPLELFPDAVLVFSPDFKLKQYNSYAERLFGLNEKSADEQNPENLFDCDFNILSQELLKENNICTLKLKNSDIFVEIKASQKTDDKIYFSLRDVTQKHKSITSFMSEYETSKKINRTKNNLLIKMSNELLSPLHSITGFSQAMLEGLSGKIDVKQKKYLTVINKNAFELLDFLDKLIEGAKLETNSYEFSVKTFDSVDAINTALNEAKEKFEKIQIFSDYSNLERRTVYTDETVFRKIIKYIISYLTINSDYGEINIIAETPDIEIIKLQGFSVDENTQAKDFIHIQITSNNDCKKSKNELSKFEIYPQLENNAKKDVIENMPLYNVSLFGKYLKIKISYKKEGKCGFDIYMNTEKP